jgi:PAS domain S-box-containing protein
MERSRRERELLLLAVINSLPNPIAVLDADGSILLVNESWVRFADTHGDPSSRSVGVGTDYLNNLRRASKASAFARDALHGIQSVIEGRQDRFALEYLTHSPSGKRWFLMVVAPLSRTSGGIVVSHFDTTQHKSLEEELRIMLESTSHAIVRVNREGKITFLNAHTETIFGYSRTELLGQLIEVLIPERCRDRHPSLRADFFANPVARTLGTGRDLYGRHKDGRDIPVEIGLNPVATQEGLEVMASLIDITVRKRAEEAVRTTALQLKATNQELEAFSYSVSHELKAPLQRLNGFSQALQEDYADKLDEQGKDYLRRLRAETQRMGRLIDNLLEFSMMTEQRMRYEPVDMSDLALTVATDLQRAWPQRDVLFLAAPGLTAAGDTHFLRILLENLIGNGWKFTSQQERARIEFGAIRQNEKTVYFVRDNGIGFDMADAEKLFAPFQRLHPTPDYPGTGLGLATARRIIHRHGGRIWAEGAVNQGATFYFTLGETHHDQQADLADQSRAIRTT